MEDKATKAFERKHGIKRPRKSRSRNVSLTIGRLRHIAISRRELLDLARTKVEEAAMWAIKGVVEQ
ncbi:hypothetical protein ACVIWV_001950 [Bradyrhizobium diazoefficiens]|uniref:hypothetical protein n=1 Tax=Bradyrhizobium TaxID=374 RepID=UPI001B8CCFAA|nr:hypothetical protein [Bradyrhizobium diazoefficiens]MBR0867607.1 hypothetical protein [Bradyrhizobium diazoefficiens]MBR0892235.1 hypothetical protein [Bradyrhizobium diazoefficiens]MBR0923978.1 hypothetical protein [Bradyrhizobium diazoefficiens]